MGSLLFQRVVRRVVLGDLSRSLRAWKNRYVKSYYRFEGAEVICMLQRTPGKAETFEVMAGSYSNDPLLVSVASHGVYWFYRDGPYKTIEEANASLFNSVARAARLHGDTQFMQATNWALDDFRIFRDGVWQAPSGSPALRRCPGCSRRVSDGVPICSNCGEPVGS